MNNKASFAFFAVVMYLGAVFLVAGAAASSDGEGAGTSISIGIFVALVGVGFTGAALRAWREEEGSPAGLAVFDRLTIPGSGLKPALPEKPETAVQQEAAAPATPAVVEEPVADASAGEPDDFTKLEGVGPKMAETLTAGGVYSFGKLAEMSLDEIRAVLDAQGTRFAPAAESWAEQASYAAKGDWDGLQKLQDTLVSGRYPTEE
ncbi:MAG: hypothetical protein AAFR22_03190 [Chloroflexota bacterium]